MVMGNLGALAVDVMLCLVNARLGLAVLQIL